MPSHHPISSALLAIAFALGTVSAQAFDDPDYATLASGALHDLPIPEPGHFWLEFEGEVHEGELRACGVVLDPADGVPFHRFETSGTWLNDAGQARFFDVFRFVSDVNASWRAIGHETDRVSVTTRLDGDVMQVASGLIDAQMPRARAEAMRREPLGDVRLRHGEGEAPLVRLSADFMHATVQAVLGVHPAPPNHDYYTDDTFHVSGPIAIAVRCES